MNCEIICVGTEILLGNITNTNAVWLSQKLADCGIDVFYQTCVGDNEKRIGEAVSLALSRSDMIITTGGLGPTKDDITKEVICVQANVSLIKNDDAMRNIEEYFKRINRSITKSNEKQAFLPEGCTVLPNDNGTAPGFVFEKDGKTIVTLPGPPSEMMLMFEKYAAPVINKGQTPLFSKYINIFGVGESSIDERMADEMACSNPTLAPYAKAGEVMLRISAKAQNRGEADKITEPVIDKLKELYNENIYGFDCENLESQVVLKLKQANKTIATAESCTGGLLSKRITDIAGSSEVFKMGVCTYSNEAKMNVLNVKENTLQQFGAVSPQTAKQMAEGIRNISGADIGIAITGIAGPSSDSTDKPVGLIYIALCDDKGTHVQELQLGDNKNRRSYNRTVSASHALFMVLKTF